MSHFENVSGALSGLNSIGTDVFFTVAKAVPDDWYLQLYEP